MIMDDFRENLLPWWQKEIENFVVEGKSKPFVIYVINN